MRPIDTDKVRELQAEGLSTEVIANRLGHHKDSIARAVAKKRQANADEGTSRYPREGESRDNNDRGSEFRPVEFQERQGELYVDPGIAEDGFTLAWIVTDWQGKPRPKFLERAINEGYVPVKASTHYSLQRNNNARAILSSVFGNSEDEYVRVGGQILCKIPTHIYNARQKMYDEKQKMRRNVGKEDGLQTIADDPTYGNLDYTPRIPNSNIF